MKRIHFVTTFFLLLFLYTSALAQERGDGIGTPGVKDPNGIITGRTGIGNNGGGLSRGSNSWFDKNIQQTFNKDGNQVPYTHGISEFGVKIGGNFQQMQHSPFTTMYSPGIVGGLYYRRFWRFTAVKIEVLGSSASYVSTRPAGYYAVRPTDSTSKSQFNSIYVSVPVLAQLKVYKIIYLELGPQYSYLASYTDKNSVFTKIYRQDNIFYTSEFSAAIGLEGRISRKFKAEARFIKGLTDVNNSIYPHAYMQWNINSIQALISYRLY